MLLPAGSQLGRYGILAHIGSGGMGDVYRARDTHLDKEVALKVIGASYARDPASQQRFERERQVMASLDHPHICRLLDAGREGDVDYLAMELLDGESLKRRIERGPVPVAAAIGYAIEIAEALHYAHVHGVVHRDLKTGERVPHPDRRQGTGLRPREIVARRCGGASGGECRRHRAVGHHPGRCDRRERGVHRA